MSENNGADIEVEIAGQKANIKNVKSLNTVATLATLVMVSVLCYAFYVHSEETKNTNTLHVNAIKDQTVAVREQTTVQREQNCLMRFDQKERKDQAEFCKQVTR